jgi:hypothetical protein
VSLHGAGAFLPVKEDAMDGIEFGREVSRLRAERTMRARLGVLWRGQPGAAAATAADCAATTWDPMRRFDALRRRPGPDPLPIWRPARPGGGPFAGTR